MNDKELEQVIGCKVNPKWVFVLHGARLFHKDGANGWTEYGAE